jgi:hypothetical protein
MRILSRDEPERGEVELQYGATTIRRYATSATSIANTSFVTMIGPSPVGGHEELMSIAA